MSKRFEGHLSGFDRTELFFQTWEPERTRGVALITHGLGEHGESYHALAEELVAQGVHVYAWDLRGHGRSDGKRGYVRHVEDCVKDLGAVHDLVTKRHPDRPLFLFGHSLGGLITLRFAETMAPRCAAVCLSSPALGLTTIVPKFKEALAHVAQRWMPTLTMSNEIKHEDLTRDPAMIAYYRTDNLRHDKISPGLFLSMVETFPRALADAADVTVPVLLQVAGDDRVVHAGASRDVFPSFPNPKSKLIVYPDSLHEIFNDLDRAQVVADLKAFLNPFLGE